MDVMAAAGVQRLERRARRNLAPTRQEISFASRVGLRALANRTETFRRDAAFRGAMSRSPVAAAAVRITAAEA
jgi:hypothetical protein